MEAMTKKKGVSKGPAYLSTHPADDERIAKQNEWMDSALQVHLVLVVALLPLLSLVGVFSYSTVPTRFPRFGLCAKNVGFESLI